MSIGKVRLQVRRYTEKRERAGKKPSLQGTIEVAFKVVEKARTISGMLQSCRVWYHLLQVNADSCYHLFLENFTDGIRALLAFASCKAPTPVKG